MLYTKKLQLLVKLGPCVALTGAGISAQSGIPCSDPKMSIPGTYYQIPPQLSLTQLGYKPSKRSVSLVAAALQP